MQPHSKTQQSPQTPEKVPQRRFQIEELELRIAPFKGGIPGGPVYGGGPPGQSPNHCPGNRGCDL